MSTLHSDALDLEIGTGPNPATVASMSGGAAAEGCGDTEPVAIDLRKACLVNVAIGVFCVVVIIIFACTAYWLLGDGGSSPSGEAFACTAAAFLLCAVSLGTVLALRKDIVGMFAEAGPAAASNM
ncbi:hypothetical protein PVAP13_7NG194400 [Panicum virgatum]|uniref:Transmembrane protein n=1 Tax=Panicum virgatum TaxID=38727 RepID=A0A8T0Q5U6_PANVG|nr:hypothetical protein PVAP13_7NG194400 [Panicum virgatum]